MLGAVLRQAEPLSTQKFRNRPMCLVDGAVGISRIPGIGIGDGNAPEAPARDQLRPVIGIEETDSGDADLGRRMAGRGNLHIWLRYTRGHNFQSLHIYQFPASRAMHA